MAAAAAVGGLFSGGLVSTISTIGSVVSAISSISNAFSSQDYGSSVAPVEIPSGTAVPTAADVAATTTTVDQQQAARDNYLRRARLSTKSDSLNALSTNNKVDSTGLTKQTTLLGG